MFLATKLRLALIVIPLRFALRLYSLKNPHFQVGYREIANRFLEADCKVGMSRRS